MTHLMEIPKCPICGVGAKRCKRPSGHDAQEWHVEREDLLARECLCDEICKPWLVKRGLLEAAS